MTASQDAEILRLRKALEFYAKAMVTNPTPGAPTSNCDDGAYARAALSSPASQDDVIVPRELVKAAIEFIETGVEPVWKEDGQGVPEALRSLLGAPTRG